jgi:hypothetical protein
MFRSVQGLVRVGAAVAMVALAIWSGPGAVIASTSTVPPCDDAVVAPTPNFHDGAIAAMADTSPSDIWAVGSDSNNHTLAEHWDGSAWTITPTAKPYTIGEVDYGLSSVVALARNDVYAAGSGHFENWNGRDWRNVDLKKFMVGGTLDKNCHLGTTFYSTGMCE